MRRKIPSTQALIIFEAAARHESLARAAKELFLTESAVSRQISALETYVSRKLFSRLNRHVALTDAGRFYADHVRASLKQIEQRTLDLARHRSETRVLELATIPTFTSLWLLPRMKTFYDQHPDIVINLSERTEPFSFGESGFDAAIHFNHSAWAGLNTHALFSQDLVPVVSPKYFDVSTLSTPQDMISLPLLHNVHRMDAWDRWLKAAGCSSTVTEAGSRYDLYSMMIDGARAGLGAGLVPRVYVADELERKSLVSPFDHCLKSEKTFCLVYPSDKEVSEPLEIFSNWLLKTSVAELH